MTTTGERLPVAADAPASLGDRIDASWEALTPQERRAADFLRVHLADVALYNSSELAALSGVSKATISRLFRRLGFESSSEVREHARRLRSGGAPIVPSAAPEGLPDAQLALERELANIRDARRGLDLGPASAGLARAGRVLIVGLRNSFPVALHLREQLVQVRGAVSLAPQPGQSLGEELAGLGAGDAILLVGFRRRPKTFARLLETAATTGATVVLLADPGARRWASRVDAFLECPLETGLPFDSYASAMSVASALASAVLLELGADAAQRVSAISALYDDLDELEG